MEDANQHAQATITPPGGAAYRDFALVMTKNLNHRYADGVPVEHMNGEGVGLRRGRASGPDRRRQLTFRAGEPVQNSGPRSLRAEASDHIRGRTPRVDGQDPASKFRAACDHGLKHSPLPLPLLLICGGVVQANLPDIPRSHHQRQ